MRIVYYVEGWPPDRYPNGIVTAAAAIREALREQGAHPMILAMSGAPEGDPDITVIRTGAAPPRLRHYAYRLECTLAPWRQSLAIPARQIAAALNRTPALADADIVEIEESFGWSRTVMRRVRPAVVTRLHGPFFLTGGVATDGVFDAFGKERIRREGEAIRAAPLVTAPSQFVLDAVRNYYDAPVANAAVIANAVVPPGDDAVWRAGEADRDEILFVGRFDRIKGADLLLDAFARLARTRPALKLTFAGPDRGPITHAGKDYGPAALAAALMPPEAAARVTFTGGLPRHEIAALRRRAGLTVIASRTEMFPNVLLESMAAGAPTVATRVGGIPEIATDGENALLAECDPGAIAAALGRLLDDRALGARLGAAARKHVVAAYSPPAVAAATLDAYRGLLADTGAR